MARKSIVWRGKQVTAKMRQAQIRGVNGTMGAAVIHAKRNHPWKNQSGVLEGGIGIVDYAAGDADGVVGTWGVQDVKYALIHELGGVIKPVHAKALAIPQEGGGVAFAKQVTIPASPYLRPAGDAEYPSLPQRIRVAFDGIGGSHG